MTEAADGKFKPDRGAAGEADALSLASQPTGTDEQETPDAEKPDSGSEKADPPEGSEENATVGGSRFKRFTHFSWKCTRTAGPPLWRHLFHRRYIYLYLALFIGTGFRTFMLEDNPPGLAVDEMLIGLTANVLGTRGADLEGNEWPIYASGDKTIGVEGIVIQPIYQYTLIPIVKAFGVSTLSIRSLSVIYGLLTIIAAFFLGKVIWNWRLGAVAALLLAIAPWHIHFSRLAYEAISMPFFLTLSVIFLLKGYNRPIWWVLSAALFAITTYCYPTAKLFVPLLLTGYLFFVLFIDFFIELWRKAKWRIRAMNKIWLARIGWGFLATLVLATMEVPNIKSQFGGDSELRTKQLLVHQAPHVDGERAVTFLKSHGDKKISRDILEDETKKKHFIVLYNYYFYFSRTFLFIAGDTFPRHGVLGMGQLYWFYLPLLILGLEYLLTNIRRQESRLLLLWLLLYPVAGSLTLGAPHAIRTVHAMPMMELIAGAGVVSMLSLIGSSRIRKLFHRREGRIAVLILVLIACIIPGQIKDFTRKYYIEYPDHAVPFFETREAKIIKRALDYKKVNPDAKIYVSSHFVNVYIHILFLDKQLDWATLGLGQWREQQLESYDYIFGVGHDPREMNPGDIRLTVHYDKGPYLNNLLLLEYENTLRHTENGYYLYMKK